MEARNEDERRGVLGDDTVPGATRLVAAVIRQAIADAARGRPDALRWVESGDAARWLSWLTPPEADADALLARLAAAVWDGALALDGPASWSARWR